MRVINKTVMQAYQFTADANRLSLTFYLSFGLRFSLQYETVMREQMRAAEMINREFHHHIIFIITDARGNMALSSTSVDRCSMCTNYTASLVFSLSLTDTCRNTNCTVAFVQQPLWLQLSHNGWMQPRFYVMLSLTMVYTSQHLLWTIYSFIFQYFTWLCLK